MTPAIVFYGILGVSTLILTSQATSLRGRKLETATVYELTDRASWVIGAALLVLLTRWWPWSLRSYAGAVLVPLVGVVLAAAAAQETMGSILSASTGTRLAAVLIVRILAWTSLVLIVRAILF